VVYSAPHHASWRWHFYSSNTTWQKQKNTQTEIDVFLPCLANSHWLTAARGGGLVVAPPLFGALLLLFTAE